MPYKGPERRRYKRINKPYMVRFKPRDAAEDEWDMVAVLNFGAGGALFYYNKDLKKGSILDVKINFTQSKPVINCTAKVLRSEKVPAGMYLIALNFIDIQKSDQDFLQGSIEDPGA
jgi:c-di-GMP-binding flagellar brake protein YcgR